MMPAFYIDGSRKHANGRDATPYKSVPRKEEHMKRTDITAQFPDATDEQIKALMDINGNDINTARRNLEELQSQLAAANTELDSLRSGAADLQTITDRANALQTERPKTSAHFAKRWQAIPAFRLQCLLLTPKKSAWHRQQRFAITRRDHLIRL